MLPVVLVSLCVVLRVLPHPPNFAPVGATAVLAGRTLPMPAALTLTLAAMFVGDVVLARLNGYPIVSLVTPFVYGGFVLQALLGRLFRSARGGALGAAVLGSVGFFVLSNLGVWLTSGMYDRSGAGLAACYVAALPFLGGTLAGDVVWTGVFALAYRAAAARLADRPRWVPIGHRELALL